MNTALEQLLQLVRNHEREECAAILAHAQDEARRIVADAYRETRTRVHGHLLELRHLMRRELSRAQATLETEMRQHQSRYDFALLEVGWKQLHAALAQRWLDPVSRSAWVEMLVGQALAYLPKVAWEIAHPADWPDSERDALAQRLEREIQCRPRFAESPDIRAGIRIRSGSAVLDGSLEGLLLDRRAIESRLLAELTRL